jgi:hypothetical protein
VAGAAERTASQSLVRHRQATGHRGATRHRIIPTARMRQPLVVVDVNSCVTGQPADAKLIRASSKSLPSLLTAGGARPGLWQIKCGSTPAKGPVQPASGRRARQTVGQVGRPDPTDRSQPPGQQEPQAPACPSGSGDTATALRWGTTTEVVTGPSAGPVRGDSEIGAPQPDGSSVE